jgi:hypothetical protein
MPGWSKLLIATILPLLAADGAAAAEQPLREVPPARWRHALAWTLSSDDVLFGTLAAAVPLVGGDVALVDVQLGQVLLVGPEGDVRQVLPVAGEGPGRLAQITGLCELPDAELLLVQAWPGRGEIVARDGTPRRSVRGGARRDDAGAPTWLAFQGSAGLVVGVTMEVRIVPPSSSLNVLRLGCFAPSDLQPTADILRREFLIEERMGLIDETAADFPLTAWTIVDASRVAVAPDRHRYRLLVHDLVNDRADAWTRDLPPLPRPQAEKDAYTAAFSLVVNGRPQAIDIVFHETAQMIQQIAALAPDTLLLRTAYTFAEPPAGTTARLDLVDLAGGTVREIGLAVPLNPWTDRLVVLPGRDIVLLRHCGPAFPEPPAVVPVDSLDPPSVQRWTYLGEGH